MVSSLQKRSQLIIKDLQYREFIIIKLVIKGLYIRWVGGVYSNMYNST